MDRDIDRCLSEVIIGRRAVHRGQNPLVVENADAGYGRNQISVDDQLDGLDKLSAPESGASRCSAFSPADTAAGSKQLHNDKRLVRVRAGCVKMWPTKWQVHDRCDHRTDRMIPMVSQTI